MAWYPSLTILFLASILLPPLGLILLWIRPRTRLRRKIFGTLPIAALGVAYLVLFFGLRVQVTGGLRPMLYFYKPEVHYAALERSRAEQQVQVIPARAPAAPIAPTVPTAAPPAAAAVAAPPVQSPPAQPASPARSVSAMRGGRWTGFRGPARDGRYAETEILNDWPSQGLELQWRQPIGGGYASFAVVNGKAFTIEQRREREVVAAYNIENGRELWTHGWAAEFQETMGGDGPRATPTWDDGRVYALGATGELRCLDADTGRRIWSHNILGDNGAENLTWGMAASPLIVEEKLIALPGGPSGKSVVAYHKITGEPIWKSLDDKQAYTSPMLVTLAGRRQLLVVSARRAMGLTVENGALLWEYPWQTEYDINTAQPIVVGENRFFISAGYGHGAALVEIVPTDKGFAARPVWQNTEMKNKFTSSVLHNGYIYGLDEAILACLDARTGQRRWKGGRYGYGQLVLAGDHLVVLSESGDLALVKAAPDRYQELARFSAIEGKTWNHPAIAAGRLLVRNTTEMACFRISR